ETDDAHREEVLETEVVPADHTFSSVKVLDLGDRQVELVHPGRGHTAGDAVLRVPDADVLLAGDLVEESAPPAYGDDCHPLDWPGTLDVVLNLTDPGTVVVPGHGAVVDRSFVEQQRQDIAVAAQTIRDLAAAGVPVDRALAEGEWPFPRDGLVHAVRRGYAALPRAGRSLPLA
ncbi:MAG: MBL fold metallo-hydrolase, partial [Nocardioides sp.]|nr:MBL fold metallo-hydrolase [Nocardioides sp.]